MNIWSYLFREPTECEKRAENILKACEHLAYGYQNALYRYDKTAESQVEIAVKHLRESGVDEEDLEPVLEPLSGIVDKTSSRLVGGIDFAQRIDSAQEELIRLAPRWIFSCRELEELRGSITAFVEARKRGKEGAQ